MIKALFLSFIIMIFFIMLPSISIFAMCKLSLQRKNTPLYYYSYFLIHVCQFGVLLYLVYLFVVPWPSFHYTIERVTHMMVIYVSISAALIPVMINMILLIVFREKPLAIAMITHIIMLFVICLGCYFFPEI